MPFTARIGGDVTEQQEFDRYVAANLRWNFTANVLQSGLFNLALNLVSQTTILPLLMSHLTTSRLALGLIPAVTSLGYLLPQLLTANYTEQLRHKKPFVLLLGMIERFTYPATAVLVWLLAARAPLLAAALLLVVRAIGAWSGGMITPPWFDLISKVIPVAKRGLFAGVGQALGAVLGIAGAALSARLLSGWAFPTSFALCYGVASPLMILSLAAFGLTREPPSLTVKPAVPLPSYFARLPEVLRRDHNLRRYLISRSLTSLGGMAAGFYMVYGVEHFGMAEREAGLLTAVLVGSQAVANLFWGPLGDRLGHKVVLCGEAVCTGLAAAAALLGGAPAWLGVTFLLLGAASAAGAVSSMNIIVEFCEAADRPTYIGLTNTILAPAAILAPLAGGWLATWAGYRPMFGVALLFAAAGGLLMTAWVREPRHALRYDVA
jgi:MFS family permease